MSFAAWAAREALRRGDLEAFDRYARQRRVEDDDLASRLGIYSHCPRCGDPMVKPSKRDLCTICRASGEVA